MHAAKIIIGWREWVGFPNLGVEQVNAKIDTGAKSSAIHAFDIKQTQIDGEDYLEFCLLAHKDRKVVCCERIFEHRTIRSSNGQSERRYVIQTTMALGDQLRAIELTLTNREAMEHRLLIGRDALQGDFVVDPEASYLMGN